MVTVGMNQLTKPFSLLKKSNLHSKKLVRQQSVDDDHDQPLSNLTGIVGQIGASNYQRRMTMTAQFSDVTEKVGENGDTTCSTGGLIDLGTCIRKTSKDHNRLLLKENRSTESATDATLHYEKDCVLQEGTNNAILRIKLTKLECCSQRMVWVFRTDNFSRYGQADCILLLEYLSVDECQPPTDIIQLFKAIFLKAIEGKYVTEMDRTIFAPQSHFLGTKIIGGVLYTNECGQCFHNLVSAADYGSLLVCRLIHVKEINYLRHAPLRLMVRLGYEDGIFPCGLVSSRYRPAVFQESDNSMYHLFKEVFPDKNCGCIPHLAKSQVTLESGSINVTLTKERHHDLLKLLADYAPNDDGILAFSGTFCSYADAHLVSTPRPPKQSLSTATFNATGVTKPSVIGVTFIALSAVTDQKSLGVTGTVAAVVEDGIIATCRKQEFNSLLVSLRQTADCTITCDWFFGIQKNKIMKKIPLKFIWRIKPGQ